MTPVRRVVTGLDATGKSTVLVDGPASSTVLWATDASPADNSGAADVGGSAFRFAMPAGGSAFLVSDMAPDGSTGPIGMHATDTLDYMIVASGRITLLTETGETVLNAGDVVIDRGVVHGWRNDGPDWCRLVGVLLPAHPVGKGATV